MTKEETEIYNKYFITYVRTYVGVNPDGSYHLFKGIPHRVKKKIYETDYNTVEEDYHGHFYHPDVWKGEYEEFWAKGDERGSTVDVNNLLPKYQNLTWKDEPMIM